jgi:hypothetical protein
MESESESTYNSNELAVAYYFNNINKMISKAMQSVSDEITLFGSKTDIVKNSKKGYYNQSFIGVKQQADELSAQYSNDYPRKDSASGGDGKDVSFTKYSTKDEDKRILIKYEHRLDFATEDPETESVDSPIIAEDHPAENDSEENETLIGMDGVSLDAVTEVSSSSSEANCNEKTGNNNRKCLTPITWQKFKGLLYLFSVTTICLTLLIFISTHCQATPLNDISSPLRSVTAPIDADSDIKNRLQLLTVDLHVAADTRECALDNDIPTWFNGTLLIPTITLLEEPTEIVYVPTSSNLMSNQTSCNFNLNEQTRPHLFYCPRSWDCMYEDMEFSAKPSISRSQKTLDLGSPLSAYALDFLSQNGSCINENWSMLDYDTCDAQAADLQTLSKSNLPFSVSNHSTRVREWFKEFASQPFEAKHTCAVNYVHLAKYAQEERSMNSNVVFLSLLYSDPLQSSALSFLPTLLAFFAISSAISSLLKMLVWICQAVRQKLPAYHTECKNTTGQAERNGVYQSLASFPGTPVPGAKSKAGRSHHLFRNVIICVAILLIFCPEQCGVENNARHFATYLMPNVSEVAGSSTIAQKPETAAAYNIIPIASSRNTSKVIIDHVFALAHAPFKCVDLHQVLIGLVVIIALYFKGNVVSNFYDDLVCRIQSWYHESYEISSTEVESTDETPIPSPVSILRDEDQHRKLSQKKKKRGSCKKRWAEKFTRYRQRPPRPQRGTFKIQNFIRNPRLFDGVVDSAKDSNKSSLDHCSPVEKDTHPTIVASPSDGQSSNHKPQVFEVKCKPDSVQTCSQVLVPASKISTRNCKFKCPTSNAEGQTEMLISRTSMPQSRKAAYHMEIKFGASVTEFESATHPMPATSEVHRTNHIPIGDLPTVLARLKNWHNDCEMTISGEIRFHNISTQFSDPQGKLHQECYGIQNELAAPVKCDCFPVRFVIPSSFQLEAGTPCHCESLMISWLSAIMTNIDNVTLSQDLVCILRARMYMYTADSIRCQMDPLSNAHSAVNVYGKPLALTIDFMLKVNPSGCQDQDIRNASFSYQPLQLTLTWRNSSAVNLITSREDIGKVNLEPQNKANILNIPPELSPFESASSSTGTKKPPPPAAENNAGKCEGEYKKKWKPPSLLAMHQQALQLSTVGAVHLDEAILSPPTLQYYNVLSTEGAHPNCSLLSEILGYCSARDKILLSATIVSQLPTMLDSPASEEITLLVCNLLVVKFHTPSPQHKKEQLLVQAIAVESRVYDDSMTIKFHKLQADSIRITSIPAHHHLTLRSPSRVSLTSPPEKEQTVSPGATCTVDPRFYDGSKRVSLREHEEIADSITASIAVCQCPTLQPVNCAVLSPIPNKGLVATVELRSYKGSKRVNHYGSEIITDGVAIATKTSTHPDLILQHVYQIPRSREKAEVTLMPSSASGEVRLNKNGQSTVKKKDLPSLSHSDSGAGTTMLSGASTCSQTHAKDTIPCSVPALQISYNPVEDSSEPAVTVSASSNSNDTTLLNTTTRIRAGNTTPSRERVEVTLMPSSASGEVRLNKNGQSTVKKKDLPSLSHSDSGAGTTMLSGASTCSQTHAKDTIPCSVPALQISYNPVEDSSEPAVTVSASSNSNDTTLLNTTTRIRAGNTTPSRERVEVTLMPSSASGEVRLNKNGQSTVKKKDLPSLSHSDSGAGTTMLSGASTCSQTHAKDTIPCSVPALQISYNPVEDSSEPAVTVSASSNSNDTTLLNTTTRIRAGNTTPSRERVEVTLMPSSASGEVRLNKNGQSTVKKKDLPSLSHSDSGAGTTMLSGASTCSQTHAKDICCVPALQNSYNPVEDSSEPAVTVSVSSNSNDTTLLNNTTKVRATKRRHGNASDRGRCDTKTKTDGSGRAGGTGYWGDKDSESSGDVKLRSTHRKERKKKKHAQPPTKQWSSSTAGPPVSLFRGKSDKPQKETNPHPPVSAYIVAGRSTHLRNQPYPARCCHMQARQLSINPRSILQLLLQYYHSHIRRAHNRPEHGTVSEDNLYDSPVSANEHISIEERSNQQHASAVVHGSVLLRPPSQELQDTVSLPFSNEVIEGILSMLPSFSLHATHPGSSVQSSRAYDSGLGTTCTCSSSISQGRQLRVLFQDDPHPHGSTLATIPIQPRVLEHSNEPNWSSAEEIVERDNDPVSPFRYLY